MVILDTDIFMQLMVKKFDTLISMHSICTVKTYELISHNLSVVKINRNLSYPGCYVYTEEG